MYAMLLPSTNDFMAETMSDTSSGRSNSFDSVDSVKAPVKGSESPLSVRTSNASSVEGSLAESTFDIDLEEIRCGAEPAPDSFEVWSKQSFLPERVLK